MTEVGRARVVPAVRVKDRRGGSGCARDPWCLCFLGVPRDPSGGLGGPAAGAPEGDAVPLGDLPSGDKVPPGGVVPPGGGVLTVGQLTSKVPDPSTGWPEAQVSVKTAWPLLALQP